MKGRFKNYIDNIIHNDGEKYWIKLEILRMFLDIQTKGQTLDLKFDEKCSIRDFRNYLLSLNKNLFVNAILNDITWSEETKNLWENVEKYLDEICFEISSASLVPIILQEFDLYVAMSIYSEYLIKGNLKYLPANFCSFSGFGKFYDLMNGLYSINLTFQTSKLLFNYNKRCEVSLVLKEKFEQLLDYSGKMYEKHMLMVYDIKESFKYSELPNGDHDVILYEEYLLPRLTQKTVYKNFYATCLRLFEKYKSQNIKKALILAFNLNFYKVIEETIKACALGTKTIVDIEKVILDRTDFYNQLSENDDFQFELFQDLPKNKSIEYAMDDFFDYILDMGKIEKEKQTREHVPSLHEMISFCLNISKIKRKINPKSLLEFQQKYMKNFLSWPQMYINTFLCGFCNLRFSNDSSQIFTDLLKVHKAYNHSLEIPRTSLQKNLKKNIF